MPLIIDHLALREPNLLIPNKKPVGLVEVDLNNPVSKGMATLHHLNNSGDSIDAISWTRYTKDSAQSIQIDEGGKASTCSTNRHYMLSSGVPALDVGTGDFSVMARFKVAQTSRCWLFHQRNNSAPYNSIHFIVNGYYSQGGTSSVSSAGALHIGGYDGNNGNARGAYETNVITNGKTYTAVGTRINNVWSLYLNGALIVTYNAGANATDVSANNDHVSIGGFATSSLYDFNGSLYISAGWTRGLHKAEAISLTNDPYQFLKPVGLSELMFIGSGDEVASDSPLWMSWF